MARREIPACGASYLGVAGCLPTRNGVSLATRLIAALVQTEDSSAVRWTSATFVGDCSTARRMRISATGGRLLVRDASYQRFVISRSMSGRPTTSLRDACRRRLLFSLHPENHARPSCDGLVPAALVSLRSKKSRAPSRRILACGTSYSRFAREISPRPLGAPLATHRITIHPVPLPLLLTLPLDQRIPDDARHKYPRIHLPQHAPE